MVTKKDSKNPADCSRTIYIEFRDANARLLRRVTDVLPGDPSSGKTIGLKSISRNCFSNSLMNLTAFEQLAGEPVSLVAGSLGLCLPPPTWFEWGGERDVPHTAVHQFRKCPVTGLPDVHFWVQTERGTIWDIVDDYTVDIVAPTHGKTITTTGLLCGGRLIAGESVEALRARGLEYVPASDVVQHVLVNKHAQNVSIRSM